MSSFTVSSCGRQLSHGQIAAVQRGKKRRSMKTRRVIALCLESFAPTDLDAYTKVVPVLHLPAAIKMAELNFNLLEFETNAQRP
jgi:hypothetical protein